MKITRKKEWKHLYRETKTDPLCMQSEHALNSYCFILQKHDLQTQNLMHHSNAQTMIRDLKHHSLFNFKR